VVKLDVPDIEGGRSGRIQKPGTRTPGPVENREQLRVCPAGSLDENETAPYGYRRRRLVASRNWRMSPMKFALKTGEPAWLKLGRRAPGRAKPAKCTIRWGCLAIRTGSILLTIQCRRCGRGRTTGLFLGPLYHDNAGLQERVFDSDSLSWKLTGAYVLRINGKTYVLAGDHGISVHEVELPKLTAPWTVER